MLLLTKDHHFHQDDSDGDTASLVDATPPSPQKLGRSSSSFSSSLSVVGQQSKFLTTSRMLQLFSAGVKAPTDDMRVVYIDGAWDLFHPGHVSTLKAAREVRPILRFEIKLHFWVGRLTYRNPIIFYREATISSLESTVTLW